MAEKFPTTPPTPPTPPEKAKEEAGGKDVEELMRMLGVSPIKREQITKPEDQPVVKHEEPTSYAEMFKPPKPEKPKAEKKIPEAEFKEMGVSEEFDVEKALEEPGAFEFVTKYAVDVEKLSKEDIKNLLEARKTSDLVKGFYREGIMKDIGLELKDEDLDKPLDVYFVNMKDVDPKFAEHIRTSIQEFHELPKRISDKEDRLKSLSGAFGPQQLPIEKMGEYIEKARGKLGSLGIEMGQMERKREISKSMHGIKGFFNWRNSGIIQSLLGGAELGRKVVAVATEAAGKKVEGAKIKRLYEEVREAKEAKSKTVDQWRVRIAILSRQIDKLAIKSRTAAEAKAEYPKAQKELEELKEKAATLKTFFFSDYFEPATNIIKIAKDKLRENLNLIADPKKTNIKTLEKGLEKLSKLGKAEIVNLGKSELGEFEKKFDDLIEQRVGGDIAARLKKLTIDKRSPLNPIRGAVDDYLQREKLGIKDKMEIEKMIVKILTNYIKRTEPPTGETPASFWTKKVAARSYLITYHANLIK